MKIHKRKLVRDINALIAPYGCNVIGLGSSAVGVQGDARSYGRSVVIRFPPDATPDRIGEVSTLITNRIHAVTRVLMDIPASVAEGDDNG